MILHRGVIKMALRHQKFTRERRLSPFYHLSYTDLSQRPIFEHFIYRHYTLYILGGLLPVGRLEQQVLENSIIWNSLSRIQWFHFSSIGEDDYENFRATPFRSSAPLLILAYSI
jgi:hypothetical protein